MDLLLQLLSQGNSASTCQGSFLRCFYFVFYWLEALGQGNSADTCQGSFLCCSALTNRDTIQVRSSLLVLMSYNIEEREQLPPPVQVLDERKGAGDEVEQWPLLGEDALGPCWHSRWRLLGVPRLQDRDVITLNSVRLFLSSHNWSQIQVSTRHFHRIRYESVPAMHPWNSNGAEEATLGLCGADLSLFGRNTRIAFHLRPFHIFATLYPCTCRRAHLPMQI